MKNREKGSNLALVKSSFLIESITTLRRVVSVSQSVGRLAGWLVSRFVGRLVGRLVCRLVGRLFGRFVGRLVGSLVGRSVGRLVGLSELPKRAGSYTYMLLSVHFLFLCLLFSFFVFFILLLTLHICMCLSFFLSTIYLLFYTFILSKHTFCTSIKIV